MSTRTNLNAAQAYQQSTAHIHQLLKQLEAGRQAHACIAAKQPGNWGFTGDVQYLESRLEELVQAFTA